jgi:HD-GYP domain-containing protein (c-di-GMP phosphodiesterase class II)
MVASYAVHHDCSVNVADAYTEAGFDFSGTKNFDKKTGYRSQSFLTVPMKNHEGEIIGVLQLINAKERTTGRVVPFSPTDQHLAESLASQAAIALTTRLLINHLEDLFESFISLINAAIDDKSPYTGGHCQRVPVLTMLLAEAVNNCHVGPLKDFTMSDRDRYELKIAGLLHDCGKVTTPVHVVDKATKLQTIYDRIDLIDTRFEVVRRDAEIELLRRQLAALQRGESADLNRDLAARSTEIDDDREFLRQSNTGGEGMKDEDIARVKAISEKYRWRDPAGRPALFLSDEELANLTIRYGTLTFAERQVINHHIEVTIQMLEALPWPAHLRNVAEYAGGHHERMDGHGYPRGLKREQMSVPARCMGIADIFEALTAKDRPYKKGKTLTEALTILGKFKLNGHVDPDLFDIFMWNKVYETYARQFLDPDQIDEVDATRIPGYVAPPA